MSKEEKERIKMISNNRKRIILSVAILSIAMISNLSLILILLYPRIH